MGFAVVAEEVRSLAQRSATAARDTATLIEASVEKTRLGSERTGHVATAVRGVTASVARVRELITSINDASAQQIARHLADGADDSADGAGHAAHGGLRRGVGGSQRTTGARDVETVA